MNNSDEFYLTLLSNSSLNYFPKNTSANFCTQLPKTIHLEGEWCVGLSEIQLPCSFFTVNDGENVIYCEYKIIIKKKSNKAVLAGYFNDERLSAWIVSNVSRGYTLEKLLSKFENLNKPIEIHAHYKTKIDAGNYESVEGILKALNEVNILQKDCVEFRLNNGSKRIHVASSSTEMTSLRLSSKLSLQLGFEPDVNILNKISTYPSNILLGLPSQLFIYSDIIEPQLIGDVFAKVLRIVVVDNNKYTYGTHRVQFFSQPHYTPVLKREFEHIEIDIRTATGERTPFQFGTVCVKLHFKRIL